MFISMLTSRHASFTGHAGITRSVSYNGVKHTDLACTLHSFIAQATLKHYMGKRYMITVPVARMREILINKFIDKGKETDIYIGDNQVKYSSQSLGFLLENQRKMKLSGYDKSDEDSIVRGFEKNELAIALVRQKKTLETGNTFVPLKVQNKSNSNEYRSFVVFDNKGDKLNDLASHDMTGEFSWFFESPWFTRNRRHPKLTFNLESLAGLVNFNAQMEHEFTTEIIGDL